MARTVSEQLALFVAHTLVYVCKLAAYSPWWILEMPFAPPGSLTSTWLSSHSTAVLTIRALTLLMALYPMPTLALALRAQLLAELRNDSGLKKQGLELQREYEKSQHDLQSWKTIVKPGVFTAAFILAIEAVLFPACLAAALLAPGGLEAFREGLAKEQSKTAAKAVEALNADKGLARLPAPPEAAKRLKLQDGATVKDAAVNLQKSIQEK